MSGTRAAQESTGGTAQGGAPSSRVILASAGSGKTYQLSHAYRTLLLHGESPSALLATTFTRKAAGEILQRVLGNLLEATASAEAEAAAAARALLGRFARDLPHGRVQTLDAFFVRLAGRFAQELGLPPGFRLGSEPELAALRAQAVSGALLSASPHDMAELLRQVQRDGAGRRVHDTLLDVVREGHELLLDSTPGAWTPLTVPAHLDAAAIAAALAAVERADLPTSGKGSKVKPNGNWVNARAAACALVRGADWEGLLGKGLGAAHLAGSSFSSRDFTPDLHAALTPLVQHARAVLLTDLMSAGRAFRALLERYDAALGACQRASGCYGFADLPRLLRGRLALDGVATALRDEGRLSHLLLDEFQDTSVAQWRVLEPLVGACLAARDGSRSLFCVGDVKQSIYGWRQGEPELLLQLAQQPGITPVVLDESRRSAQVVLDAVNAVYDGLPGRTVFADTDTRDRAPLREAAARWANQFRAHRAHDQALAGCFSLREVAVKGPDNRSQARRRAVLEAACEHVAALAAQAPDSSIGLLVRWRSAIAPLIHGLRQRGVHACGEGGNQLTDSSAVLAALSLLTLVDHPGDTAAAFHVASSPLAPALGISAEEACACALGREPDCAAQPAAAPRLAAVAALRSRLSRVGHGVLLAEWAELVAVEPSYSAWDRARFAQLVDLGYGQPRGVLRADAFVSLVREQRVEDPGSARVRVLTVHAAKGLEYDAVVLPDLDYELPRMASRAPKFLSSRRGADGSEVPAGPVTAVVRFVKADLAQLDPLLEELAAREQRRTLEEELSVLYVALTRARVRLDLFLEARSDGSGQRSCRFGELLRECFATSGSGASPREDGVLVETGAASAAWPPPRGDAAALPAPAAAPAGAGSDGPGGTPADQAAPAVATAVAGRSAVAAPPALTGAFAASAHRLPRGRSPSAGTHAVQHRAREILASPPRAALERGLLLHRFCQEVEWLEGEAGRPSGGPTRERLFAGARELVARRGLLLDDAALQRALADFEALLGTPAARGVFRRPAQAPAGVTASAPPVLWRERRFAVPAAEGELLRGAFDRVVLWRADGRVVAAQVIDFKSDAPPQGGAADIAAWLADRAARYAPQMRDYRAALASLTGLPPAGIECRLLFLLADAVRDVPA